MAAASMQQMRSSIASRLRSNSSAPIPTVPPAKTSPEYSSELALQALRILYRSPLPLSEGGTPVFILNHAAILDDSVEYIDRLVPYCLARLPDEEELLSGPGYDIVFFAGAVGDSRNATESLTSEASQSVESIGMHEKHETHERHEKHDEKAVDKSENRQALDHADSATTEMEEAQDRSSRGHSSRPGLVWMRKIHQSLGRLLRKKLRKMYVVHESRWIRLSLETFATVISPKARKKIIHGESFRRWNLLSAKPSRSAADGDCDLVSTITALALYLPIQDLLIPSTAYLVNRRREDDIYVPYATGYRAFGRADPFPAISCSHPTARRLPRVLREATSFIVCSNNIIIEGIFRISARSQIVDILQEAYDRGQKFIVWKEKSEIYYWPHHGDSLDRRHTIEADPVIHSDGYDVHSAAGLIKAWYRANRHAIFCASSYQEMNASYGGNAEADLEVQVLKDMLRIDNSSSPISVIGRMILTRHLLPLLAQVASHADENKMTASNLAVCFSPTMLRGPDTVEDMKMLGIVRTLLTAMIENWHCGLSAGLGIASEAFSKDLALPADPADQEDSLELAAKSGSNSSKGDNERSGSNCDMHELKLKSAELGQEGFTSVMNGNPPDPVAQTHLRSRQQSEITADRDVTPGKETSSSPPLPPRRTAHQNTVHDKSGPLYPSSSPVHRKPAPVIPGPPRYSTIMSEAVLPMYHFGVETSHPVLNEGAHHDSRPLGDQTVNADPEALSNLSIATMPQNLNDNEGSRLVLGNDSRDVCETISQSLEDVDSMSSPQTSSTSARAHVSLRSSMQNPRLDRQMTIPRKPVGSS